MNNIYSVFDVDSDDCDDNNDSTNVVNTPRILNDVKVFPEKQIVQKPIEPIKHYGYEHEHDRNYADRQGFQTVQRNVRQQNKTQPNKFGLLLMKTTAGKILSNAPTKNTGHTLVQKHVNYDGDKPVKRILCKNTIIKTGCPYPNTCKYAHNLEEQIIDDSRMVAINMLKDSSCDLSGVETKNSQIYDLFLLYTKACQYCVQNKCVGGYNCKHGSPTEELVVCGSDLLSGECPELNDCTKIHLTKRGFVPHVNKRRLSIINNLQSSWKNKIVVGSKETLSRSELDIFVDDMAEKVDSDDELSSGMVELSRETFYENIAVDSKIKNTNQPKLEQPKPDQTKISEFYKISVEEETW